MRYQHYMGDSCDMAMGRFRMFHEVARPLSDVLGFLGCLWEIYGIFFFKGYSFWDSVDFS